MITEDDLTLLGFNWNDSNCSFMSLHIGGPWFLHAYFASDFLGLMYGGYNFRNETPISIWSTFKDVEKLKQLIYLLKGDKK